MSLPICFPSPPAHITPSFKAGTMTVAIDEYKNLNYYQSLFVYRTVLRIGHKKSILDKECARYDNSSHFTHIFSFKPFNPSWFVSKLVCTVRGLNVFPHSVTFDEPSNPQIR